jgi:predicted RNA-binding Zn ribbon-like protein
LTETAQAPRFRQGAGRLSLDFIRTLRHRGSEAAAEELASAAALAAWITRFGPCPARAEDIEATGPTLTTVRARLLREAVYELIAAARDQAGAGSCSPAARRVVNETALLPRPSPQLDSAARLRWEAADPVAATLAVIACDAIDLVTSPAIARVRDCANPECNAMFLDSSRPGSRRWCSMGTCGNQAKKSTLRNKRADQAETG